MSTLENIQVHVAVYAAWLEKVGAAAQEAVALGIWPEAVPDEQATPLPDGNLLIWVDVPGFRRVSMLVPKEHWHWKLS
jgi:hypothetical protein